MTRTTTKGEFTGWHMLALMCAFFGVIIGVNVFMAVSATRTWTGLVVENSYVASQQFNTKLAIARERTAAGWQGGLDYADGTLRFTLAGSDGEPVDIDTVTVAINRPVGVVGDQTVTLSRAADGSHIAPLDLAPGVWNAAIVATIPGEPDYEHHARLIVGD